jgi:hypothetical protein
LAVPLDCLKVVQSAALKVETTAVLLETQWVER